MCLDCYEKRMSEGKIKKGVSSSHQRRNLIIIPDELLAEIVGWTRIILDHFGSRPQIPRQSTKIL